MSTLSTVELALRLLAAVGAGAVLGLERQVRDKVAGVRTHALVAVGAALFTIAGAHGFGEIPRGPNVDPLRVAAQVVSGIGFIGAGAIMRDGTSVRGVTTAATLWLSAALGVSAGAGAWGPLFVGSAVVAFALVGLRALVIRVDRLRSQSLRLSVSYPQGSGTLADVLDAMERLNLGLSDLSIDDSGTSGWRRVTMQTRARTEQAAQLVADLESNPDIVDVTLGAA
ncbi:MgtC/SapB family protein [Pedococcus sp. 5OH_020]|uniref:MgtC/SapB family protein n=1 Tax=Pedococcus sp. 5OH_020 TaxID=2989814 RepID=UPI0022E9D669|nr:MgtC/SapB family protein [Pedococcus sp. 5OH_020]